MANFVKKALLSLVMDKRAREKLELIEKAKDIEAVQTERTAVPAPTPSPSLPKRRRATPPSGNAVETFEAPDPAPPPTERDQLIRDALAIRREKTKLIDELSPEDQFKLKVMAARAFLFDRKDDSKN